MKLHSIISWILLAYFALFIVPPAATFASSHYDRATVAREAGYSLVQDHNKAPLLLFDIVLWQKLKKTKLSEEFLASFPGDVDNGATWTQSWYDVALIQLKSDASRLVNFIGHVSLIHQSRSSSIRFSRSGISPPAFPS